MQQYTLNYLPASFNVTWILNSARRGQNEAPMRNNDDFYTPLSRLALSDRLPFISFPKLWNSFPNGEIKFIRNKLVFNSKLKQHFFNNLQDSVHCTRLTCQACNPFNIWIFLKIFHFFFNFSEFSNKFPSSKTHQTSIFQLYHIFSSKMCRKNVPVTSPNKYTHVLCFTFIFFHLYNFHNY